MGNFNYKVYIYIKHGILVKKDLYIILNINFEFYFNITYSNLMQVLLH